MGGPNLEVFKFSLYLFFPLATLIHYSNPKWYQEHVVPVPGPRFLFRRSADIRSPIVSNETFPPSRKHKCAESHLSNLFE